VTGWASRRGAAPAATFAVLLLLIGATAFSRTPQEQPASREHRGHRRRQRASKPWGEAISMNRSRRGAGMRGLAQQQQTGQQYHHQSSHQPEVVDDSVHGGLALELVVQQNMGR